MLDKIQKRLSWFQENTTYIQNDVERIRRYRPLESQKGKRDVEEINRDIVAGFRAQEEEYEELYQIIQDLPDGRWGSETQATKERLTERAERLHEELKAVKADFNKARSQAIFYLKLIKRKERKHYVKSIVNPPTSAEDPNPRRRTPVPAEEQTQDEKLVGAAGNVTAALRQTHALLANELNRSQFAHETLKDSSAALGQLSENYMSLDSVLSSTKSLLGTLMKSQKSDTWYLETAFYILLSTVIWLIFRRFLYGPAWWFVWLPLKLGWKFVFSMLSVFGYRGGSAVSGGENGSLSGVSTMISGTASMEATVSGTDAPRVQVASEDSGPEDAGSEEERERPLSEQIRQMAKKSKEKSKKAASLSGKGGEQQQKEQVIEPNPLKRQWEEPDVGPKKVEREEVETNEKKRQWEEDTEAARHKASDGRKDEL